MALFASTALPVLASRVEKLEFHDDHETYNNSSGKSSASSCTVRPDGIVNGEIRPAKGPMHSILKSHEAKEKDHSVSAPLDVPIKKSASAPPGQPMDASVVSGSFSASPGRGSYQDMWKLWVDEVDDDAAGSEFPKIMPPARRSVSLKAQKTPPGTPSPKKMVRFADAMGLDLEKVRHFFQEQLPNTDAGLDDAAPICSLPTESFKYQQITTKYLSATFPQPCLASTFLDRVRNQKICLDSVQINECLVTGYIRVLNVSFEKSVIVRYTFDNWKTSLDSVAQYVPNSNDNFSDRFQFVIHAPPYFNIGDTMQFCLCYRANEQEFWDSNYGQNYSLMCCAGTGETSSFGSSMLPSPSGGPSSFITSAFW